MKKGFTLIELLVVVLIIAILAAVALPQYAVARERTRIMEAIATVSRLGQAADRYYMANAQYPTTIFDLDVLACGSKSMYPRGEVCHDILYERDGSSMVGRNWENKGFVQGWVVSRPLSAGSKIRINSTSSISKNQKKAMDSICGTQASYGCEISF